MRAQPGIPRAVEQGVTHHAMRVVTIRTLGVAVHQVAVAEQSARLGQIAIANIVNFTRCALVGTVDRHADTETELSRDVLNVTRPVGDDRCGGVTLVAGLLDRRIAAGFGRSHGICTLAQQPA